MLKLCSAECMVGHLCKASPLEAAQQIFCKLLALLGSACDEFLKVKSSNRHVDGLNYARTLKSRNLIHEYYG